jgi:hypothetical protein
MITGATYWMTGWRGFWANLGALQKGINPLFLLEIETLFLSRTRSQKSTIRKEENDDDDDDDGKLYGVLGSHTRQ